MGAGHQKVQAMIRNLEFSTLLPILQRGTRNGVDDQSCLHDEVSIKIPKVHGSESFWFGEHMEMLGEWSVRENMESSCPFPRTLPYASLSSGFSSISFTISFYNK